MDNITLILYGTSGCHLCDEALLIIKEAITQTNVPMAVKLIQIDIVDDDALYSLYETAIPVLKIDSQQYPSTLNWPFNTKNIGDILSSLQP